MDPVYFFTILHLGLYASLHPNRFVSLLKENRFLSIFLALVALYVIIYTPIYGKCAIGEARKFYFMFLFPLLALIVIKTPEELRRFVRVVILSAAFVALFALALAAKQGSILRAVNSECSLIIAFAAFAMLIHRFHRVVVFHPIVDRLLLFLFAALTIGSGQRSVWLAVGLGSLLLLLLHSGRRTLMAKIAVAGLAFFIAMGTAFIYFPEAGARLGEKFAGIINPSSDATASWRIEGWRDQLERLAKLRKAFVRRRLWRLLLVVRTTRNNSSRLVPTMRIFSWSSSSACSAWLSTAFWLSSFFAERRIFRKRLPPGPMKAYLDMGILNFGAGHAYMLGYGIVPVMLVFFAVTVCAIKLSENLHKVTTRSPVRARRFRRVGWQPNMPAPRMPMTRYER